MVRRSVHKDIITLPDVLHVFSRIEFQQEAKRLVRLADRNVARLLGASLEDDPMCIVLENGEYGDLNQYLQSHIAETSNLHSAKTLRYDIHNICIYIFG